ncbi:MAG: DotD/TraH family lipoprotein [Rhodospirillales bacterium]|nr:DotD/TraH family lipoprotein [Rhodospirillales bacterium]MDE0378490.1 DotD/TraH family lipoprotein [Rhodospirillales bacterium]
MRAVLAALLALSLAGCAQWLAAPTATPVSQTVSDTAELRLVEAAERAGRALARLARTLPARDAAGAMPALGTVPPALRQPVTLDWTGPVETLAATLARRAGYRFLEAGRPPARPVIVAVEAEAQPLIAVLRDAAIRAGDTATLTVDAPAESVVLDWTAHSHAKVDK